VLTRVSLCDESWAEARLEADTAVRLFIAAADGDRRTFEEAQLMKPLRSRWSSDRVVECSELSFCRPAAAANDNDEPEPARCLPRGHRPMHSFTTPACI
jgi:hypothetical protein